MSARERVKTIVSRACNKHPEVKQRRAAQIFPVLASTKSQATSFAAYDWTTWPGKISPI